MWATYNLNWMWTEGCEPHSIWIECDLKDVSHIQFELNVNWRMWATFNLNWMWTEGCEPHSIWIECELKDVSHIQFECELQDVSYIQFELNVNWRMWATFNLNVNCRMWATFNLNWMWTAGCEPCCPCIQRVNNFEPKNCLTLVTCARWIYINSGFSSSHLFPFYSEIQSSWSVHWPKFPLICGEGTLAHSLYSIFPTNPQLQTSSTIMNEENIDLFIINIIIESRRTSKVELLIKSWQCHFAPQRFFNINSAKLVDV